VLRCLVENPNRVVDRATLLRQAWGYDDPGGSDVVEAQVKSIRRKLGGAAQSRRSAASGIASFRAPAALGARGRSHAWRLGGGLSPSPGS
jgi:hypothetical protein